MDEDGTSITDVTEFSGSADDLDNFDPESSSELTSSDTNDDGTITAIHTPLQLKQFNIDTAASMSVDKDSEKEDNVAEADGTVRRSPIRYRGSSPTPLETFAKGAKPVDGISYSASSGQSALTRGKHVRGGARPKNKIPEHPLRHLPNFQNESAGHWYDHQCFDHYWHHYHFVSTWCQKHMEVYRTTVEEHAKDSARLAVLRAMNLSQKTKVHPEGHTSKRTVRNRKARRRRKLAKQRMRLALAQAERMGSHSSLTSTEDEQREEDITTTVESAEGDEDHDEEIPDEMLDFFAHTHKHRLERDAKKKNKTGKEEKHVNIEEVQGEQRERTTEAPKERPGSTRTKEMRFLYGKGAAMIHAMETALQMNFDRNIDIWQPKMWPNMPFKIIFN